MRSALFVSALLATALFGGTALAERTNDDSTGRHISSAQDLKEKVAQERNVPQTFQHETTHEHTAAPAKLANFRSKGENYESYGQGRASATTKTESSNHSSAPMPSRLQAGRSHGDVVDSTSHKSAGNSAQANKAVVGSTQATWTAGGKNVRSFVHSTNDRGQTNNNIHGATASAMKMRDVASVLMKTAGLSLVHMSWGTTGGDNMSLFPGN